MHGMARPHTTILGGGLSSILAKVFNSIGRPTSLFDIHTSVLPCVTSSILAQLYCVPPNMGKESSPSSGSDDRPICLKVLLVVLTERNMFLRNNLIPNVLEHLEPKTPKGGMFRWIWVWQVGSARSRKEGRSFRLSCGSTFPLFCRRPPFFVGSFTFLLGCFLFVISQHSTNLRLMTSVRHKKIWDYTFHQRALLIYTYDVSSKKSSFFHILFTSNLPYFRFRA